jgi:hypothetical protein
MALADVTAPADFTGGVVQANPDAIARSLVGNDLVDKYGHAMGVRPTTPADVARDAYLGATVGPVTVRKLHADAQQQLQENHFAALREGLARQEAARQKMQTMIQGLKTVMDPKLVPLSQRARIYTNLMTAAGYPPDKDVVAMLTDAKDKNGEKNLNTLLSTAVNQGMTADEFGAINQDMSAFLDFKKSAIQMAAQQQATANAVVVNAMNQKRLERFNAAPVPLTLEEQKAADYYQGLLTETVPVVDANGDPQVGPDNKIMQRGLTATERDDRMRSAYPRVFQKTHEVDPMSLIPPDNGNILGLPAASTATPTAAAATGLPGLPFLGQPKTVNLPGGRTATLPENANAGTVPAASYPAYKTPPPDQGQDLSIPNNRGVVKLRNGLTATANE